LPAEFTEKIINKIKDKSCLYIYYPTTNSWFYNFLNKT
jgi:hypothetical protein